MVMTIDGEWTWRPASLCSIEGEGDEDNNDGGSGAGDGGSEGEGSDGSQGQDGSGGGDGGEEGGEQGKPKARLGKSRAGLHATLGGDEEGKGGEGDGDNDDDGDGEGKGGKKANGQDGAPYTLRADGTLSVKDAPEWFPKDHIREDGTLDLKGMADRMKGLREKIAIGGDKAPDSADGYKFELPEQFKDIEGKVFPEGADKDPLLNWFKGEAHRLGMSPDQFQEVTANFIEERAKLLPPPLDGKKEMEALGENGAATVAYFHKMFNDMADAGVLNEEDLVEAEIMTMTASGIRFLSKLAEHYGDNIGEKRIAHIQPTAKDARSASELEADQAKWMTELSKGNPRAEAELNKIEKEFEKIYGTEPAGSSTVSAGTG